MALYSEMCPKPKCYTFKIQTFSHRLNYYLCSMYTVRAHDSKTELVTVWWPGWIMPSSQLFFVAVLFSICTVYAKCKLLFATLTHMQSNSCSLVLWTGIINLWISCIKNKMWAALTLQTWLMSPSLFIGKGWFALLPHLIQTTWDTWNVI